MAFTAQTVKDLREKTGAGILDCQKALKETDGDIEKAIDWLRAKGIAKAAKKADRAATEGAILSYIHGAGRIGVLLEVNSETDFVARNDDFQEFCRDIAMHIAAASPSYVKESEIPAEVIEREKAVAMAQVLEEGKPAHIAEKIVTGRVQKFVKEVCLLDQPFIKDDSKTVAQLQTEFVARCGENVQIRRFVRWGLGEGLAKKQDDFAAEVARMAGAGA